MPFLKVVGEGEGAPMVSVVVGEVEGVILLFSSIHDTHFTASMNRSCVVLLLLLFFLCEWR